MAKNQGKTRQYINYTIHVQLSEIGPYWEARRASDGSLLVRTYSSYEDCKHHADSMTEEVVLPKPA